MSYSREMLVALHEIICCLESMRQGDLGKEINKLQESKKT